MSSGAWAPGDGHTRPQGGNPSDLEPSALLHAGRFHLADRFQTSDDIHNITAALCTKQYTVEEG